MGPDDRQIVSVNQKTPAAIRQTGQIRIFGEAFVTGIVTGANCDVVLSAGHAAFYWQTVERKGWLRGNIRGQGQFSFSLDPLNKHTFIKMDLVRSGYENENNLDYDKHDWSVFRLERPVLNKCEEFHIITTKENCPGTVMMPAFHFDKPDNLLIDRTCRVKGSTRRGNIVHNCDTKEGSSGAPLFCHKDGKLELYAINISGSTEKEYQDPGVYGLEGNTFHIKKHKNHAVSIQAEFYQAVVKELGKSKKRFELKLKHKAGENI